MQITAVNLVEMDSSLLFILIATGFVSWQANQRPDLKDKLLLHPFRVKHENQWFRVLTHAFVHGDSTHLLVNLFVLWQFGSQVEALLASDSLVPLVKLPGNYSFLMLYFGGILFAALPAMLRHKNNPDYRSLGASGAVSAVLIFYIIHFPTVQLLLFFVIPIPAFLAGILFFVYEGYMDRKGGGRIAHDAHLYGGLYGLIFALLSNDSAMTDFITAVENFLY